MLKTWWYPIVYMFVVTATFSSIVIGFTRYTREKVEANQRLAFEKAVLQAVNLYDPRQGRSQMHQKFKQQIAEPTEATAGAYTYQQNGSIEAYALPISGQGFWAPIKGVIGIDRDRRTVLGIAFYEQNETPGLGAEITEPQFKNQFEGKTLADREKPITFERPGEPLDDSSVHAVTGATQTSVRVERIINNEIKNWRSEVE